MPELTTLERAVLEKLLHGDHPVLVALRTQLQTSEVASREFTGVGFYTNLRVHPNAVAAPVQALAFGDVVATIHGLQHGAGFVLFIKGGRLAYLEGYTYDERWPDPVSAFQLEYVVANERGELSPVPSSERDLSILDGNRASRCE